MNKRWEHKYGKLPAKLAITNPCKAVCVDLIRPYTLKEKDQTQIDVMCVTMIDPATSWFEIKELPLSTAKWAWYFHGYTGVQELKYKQKKNLIW